jgi:ribosomal protein S18 acetylase RimI-like enzyme
VTVIRPYRPGDRAAVYDVCVRTAAAGQDARGRYASDELMGDLFAGPYLELEPERAFVLEDDGRVAGYVLGTADTRPFVRRYTDGWLPYLTSRYPPPAAASDAGMLELGLHPERLLRPELEPYPAHLHIDLLPAAQGRGLGRRLMATFLTAVAAAGAPGVHLGMDPANTRARGFYERLGFRPIPADDPGVIYLARSA